MIDLGPVTEVMHDNYLKIALVGATLIAGNYFFKRLEKFMRAGSRRKRDFTKSTLQTQPHSSSLKFGQENTDHCPRCGKDLVRRTAKTGPSAGKDFLGCSGFPECRYTKDIR